MFSAHHESHSNYPPMKFLNQVKLPQEQWIQQFLRRTKTVGIKGSFIDANLFFNKIFGTEARLKPSQIHQTAKERVAAVFSGHSKVRPERQQKFRSSSR